MPLERCVSSFCRVVPQPSKLFLVISSDLSILHNTQVLWSRVKNKTWLCENEGDKKVLIGLEARRGEDVSYEPGDHAAVYPVNSDEDVDLVMKHLNGLPRKHDQPVLLQEYKQSLGKKDLLGRYLQKVQVGKLSVQEYQKSMWYSVVCGIVLTKTGR